MNICNNKNKFRHSYYVTLAGLSFDHRTEICCFSSKYAEFRSKGKDLTGLLYPVCGNAWESEWWLLNAK
jgi:hypothetical protein